MEEDLLMSQVMTSDQGIFLFQIEAVSLVFEKMAVLRDSRLFPSLAFPSPSEQREAPTITTI
jgi:hypothetical protein